MTEEDDIYGTRDYIFMEFESPIKIISHNTHCSNCDYPHELTNHSDYSGGLICDICSFITFQDFVEEHPQNECKHDNSELPTEKIDGMVIGVGWQKRDCDIMYRSYEEEYNKLVNEI